MAWSTTHAELIWYPGQAEPFGRTQPACNSCWWRNSACLAFLVDAVHIAPIRSQPFWQKLAGAFQRSQRESRALTALATAMADELAAAKTKDGYEDHQG